MIHAWPRTVCKTCVSLLILATATLAARAQSNGLRPPLDPQPKAEEIYKNIQVFRGISADQMGQIMVLFASSLGVDCEFCHVKQRELDTKQSKRTAREMVRMVLDLNKNTFGDRNQVTCYTCHRGSIRPVGPAPPAGSSFRGLRPEEQARAEDLDPGRNTGAAGGPAPDRLLDNFVRALGGMDALRKISSRIQKGTATDHAGRRFGVEFYSKAPDRSLQILHTPEGDMIEAFIGKAGWGKIATAPPRPNQARQNEIDAAMLEDQLYLATHLKQILSGLRTGPPEKVGGRDAYVLHANAFGRVPVEFYFDQSSGNLLRLVYYQQTPFGYNPAQIDFIEYRQADGVQAPVRWTVSKVAVHLSVQIDQLQQNATIDETRFSLPPRPAP